MSPLPLSQDERDRLAAEARQLRSEAMASLFCAVGRGVARLFAAPRRNAGGRNVPAGA